MSESKKQLQQLQQAFQEDAGMQAVINAFSTYQYAVSEVNVDRIWSKAGRSMVKRSRIVAALKMLQELGFGTYIKGAHGHPSRFGFAHLQRPDRLALQATGAEDDELPDDFSTTGPDEALRSMPGQLASLEENSNHVAHRFRLRESIDVVFSLPRDLTYQEAKRLSLWIKSLPFDSEADEF